MKIKISVMDEKQPPSESERCIVLDIDEKEGLFSSKLKDVYIAEIVKNFGIHLTDCINYYLENRNEV